MAFDVKGCGTILRGRAWWTVTPASLREKPAPRKLNAAIRRRNGVETRLDNKKKDEEDSD